ncbi:hypothetical protein M472_06415 [Sphingobacterium paucimobilis HER1398]|uniref:Bacteriocin n=1 Tax=Sphingobacterium paucimobilis HER1398 TaxID=1346330 RepID=U2H9H6_9SPHI|nr:hypothetical protein M472_06415 [Sphingobacterium paucimobilis HER1398]
MINRINDNYKKINRMESLTEKELLEIQGGYSLGVNYISCEVMMESVHRGGYSVKVNQKI